MIRKTKNLIFIVSALMLLSCSKDEPVAPTTNPREEFWWGYFDGTFDGTLNEDDMTVSFVNDEHNQRTGSRFYSYSPEIPEGSTKADRHTYYVKNIEIVYVEGASEKESSYISISLSGLHPGTKYAVKPSRYDGTDDWDCSTIYLSRDYPGESEPVRYVPSKENPFRIVVKDVEWIGQSLPAVELQLEGVLYREDAPQSDSIAINAFCGIGIR